MITLKAKDLDYSGTKDRVEGECLSTDTKPTTYANGSVLIEMDTGDRFMFDEAGEQWLNITNPGGGEPEVWLVGDTGVEAQGMMLFELSNVDATDHLAELLTNGANYKVFLNGTELPYLEGDENEANWADSNDDSTKTMGIGIENDSGTLYGTAVYYQASTAPTSVEVRVKAK